MARLEDRTDWLSLPEAAVAAHITLPTLRYLVRRLALALGTSQDDRGNTYLPAARLEDLRRAVGYRTQGLELEQIEKLLLQRDREAGETAHQGLVQAGVPQPSSPARPSRLRAQAEPPTREHSLPFPFTPVARTGGSRRSRSHGSAGRRELPFPSDDLRQELAALRQENRELRERMDELVAWLRAREGAPVGGPVAPRPAQIQTREQPTREPEYDPPSRRVAVAADPVGELSEGTRLTRTPSGNVRPAVVRNWHPPALNGRR